ncbi:MAG: ABC transporter ATP-binding protein [Phycisphaerae bacterium]
MHLQAENIAVERDGRRVLDQVCLELQAGQCLAVVGPNGAGKTTLMQALLGLLPLAAGTVRLDGQPLERLSRRQIARRIAYVPQGYEGYMGFRVRDVVETGRYAHRGALGRYEPDDQQAVERAIGACDLVGLEDRTVDSLSGGERQKVWLAAALAQESPALFLDEPTSALDPKHQVELIRLMQRQVASGKTLLVICHDLNLPTVLGCRVLAMRAGRKVFEGQIELDLARLREIFQADFELVAPRPGGQVRVHLQV